MHEVIAVEGLGKYYSRYRADRPVSFREAVLAGFRGLFPVERNWTLRGVTVYVRRGEMLGVIGKNGAGKSTFLNILGGIVPASRGSIRVCGRIGALLELGAGFQGDLTGRENVFINGIVAGLRKGEVARRLDEILEFAELQGFVDHPLRTYSTGMQMRLAFAIAVHTDPEVLLVDEFLSVGDLAFQAKCLQRVRELRDRGCAIVFVSHNLEHVEEMCDHALWLRGGQVAALGEPEQVVNLYRAEMNAATCRLSPAASEEKQLGSGEVLRLHDNRHGSLEGEITGITLEPGDQISPGDALIIKIGYAFPRPLRAPVFSVTISRRDGQVCFDTNTQAAGVPTPVMEGQGEIELRLARLDLAGGDYFVDVGVHEYDWGHTYDYHWHVYPLCVQTSAGSRALLQPPSRWILDPRQQRREKSAPPAAGRRSA